MVWALIVDADLDGNSPLKTNVVCRALRDNFEFVAAGDASVPIGYRIGLEEAYLVNQPAGYIRPDGSAEARCIVAPVEISDLYIFDESVLAWPIPAGVRQFIVEVWGGGSFGSYGLEGGCSAYAMKLFDVVGSTVKITVGEGGASSGGLSGGGTSGGDSVVEYGGVVVQAEGGIKDAPCFATGGDINIDGGGMAPVRAGGGDVDSGDGLMGAPGYGYAVTAGGKGRVVLRVLG